MKQDRYCIYMFQRTTIRNNVDDKGQFHPCNDIGTHWLNGSLDIKC